MSSRTRVVKQLTSQIMFRNCLLWLTLNVSQTLAIESKDGSIKIVNVLNPVTKVLALRRVHLNYMHKLHYFVKSISLLVKKDQTN